MSIVLDSLKEWTVHGWSKNELFSKNIVSDHTFPKMHKALAPYIVAK